MKKLFAGLCALSMIFLSSAPVQAQSKVVEPRPSAPYYDVANEVTLTGVVMSVLRVPSEGMIAGSHILLATSSGKIDASLGRWGLEGSGALSVAPGQVIEATGVVRTLLGNPVFVIRTAKAGDQTYQIRNEFGIPVSPQARERALQSTAQKGESQ